MDTIPAGRSDQRLPIYQRLKDTFVHRITQGEWTPAHPIPSETQLSADFGVSVGTVRRAIEDMVQEGFLLRTQGKGTYVRRADFGNALMRFFRYTDTTGAPLRPRSKMLSVTPAPAQATINKRLQIEPSAPLLQLLRLRLIADTPMLHEEIFVSRAAFAPLLSIPLADFGDLLYPLYEAACGHRVFRATETLRFDQAPDTIAQHLGVAPGEPIAVIERLAIGLDGHPLEWRRSVGLARQFTYSIELQ
ncbi:MAG: GntR family transcriptional regulator [Castellaniella sp.]